MAFNCIVVLVFMLGWPVFINSGIINAHCSCYGALIKSKQKSYFISKMLAL